MIKDFCKAWEKNNGRLREYISSHNQSEYSNYSDLVKIIFEQCINPYIIETNCKYCRKTFNINNLTEIDDGDCQGTLLFIIPLNTYQPIIDEYIVTYVDYGSCSYCDTLQGIQDFGIDIPTESQVNDYMELLLHLLQNCKWIIDKEEK